MLDKEREGEMLEEHEKILKENVLPRLDKMENVQESFADQVTNISGQVSEISEQVSTIKSTQQSLELTVMKDGQVTRDLLTQFVNHYFEKDNRKYESEEKVTLAKLSVKEKVLISIFGAGGLAGMVSAIAMFFAK